MRKEGKGREEEKKKGKREKERGPREVLKKKMYL
jgi:hypothetical protein